MKVRPLSNQVPRHCLLAALSALLLSGCAPFATHKAPEPVSVENPFPSPVFETAAGCRQRLSVATRDWIASETSGQGFGQRLVVATWNVQKSRDGEWQGDVRQLTETTDILLLQEAALALAANKVLPYSFVAVSEGYRASKGITGILSASHVDPLASCTFIDREPILGTPKASSVTSYPLRDRGETLLVVNVHSINFSLGMSSYRNQLERIARALRSHDGPIILAGDFNIWNGRRAKFVASIAKQLELREVTFGAENGKSVFGYPLDRIFWRGMRLNEAKVVRLASSDHDALVAAWRLQP